MNKSLALFLIFIVSGLASCSSEEEKSPANGDEMSQGGASNDTEFDESVRVDGAGETISLSGGDAVLNIFEGALADEEEIEARVVEDGAPAGALSEVFEWQPTGLEFNRPVLLTLKWSGDLEDDEFPTIFHRADSDEDWEALPTVVDDDQASSYIEHFTQFVVLPSGNEPVVPMDNVSVSPATRVATPGPTWDVWEVESNSLTISGTASPDGTGTWYGGFPDGTTPTGTFEIENGQFSLELDRLDVGNTLALCGVGSCYTVDLRCPDDGCPGDGGGSGGNGSGGGGTGGSMGTGGSVMEIGDTGCKMTFGEETAPQAGDLTTSGSTLLATNGGAIADSISFNINGDGSLTQNGTFDREYVFLDTDAQFVYGHGFNRFTVMELNGTTAIPELRGQYNVASDAALATAMGLVGQVSPETTARVAPSGNVVFLSVDQTADVGSERHGGLVVMDVTTPTNPTRIGLLTLGTTIARTPVVDNLNVYLATSGLGATEDILFSIDVSDGSNPTIQGQVTLPFIPSMDAELIGTTLVIGWESGGDAGIMTVDVSDPTNPVVVGTLTIPGRRALGQLAALGNWVFTTATSGKWLGAIDVSDPANPAIIGGKIVRDDLAGIRDAPIVIHGANVFTTNGSGIIRYDVSACFL